jgi:hypothetical protein
MFAFARLAFAVATFAVAEDGFAVCEGGTLCGVKACLRKSASSWGFKGREKNLAKEITEDESLSCGNPKAEDKDTAERGAFVAEEAEGLAEYVDGCVFTASVFFADKSEIFFC